MQPINAKAYSTADLAALCAQFRTSLSDLVQQYPELILVEEEFCNTLAD